LKTVTGQNGRKPWDFDGLYGKINQKGEGGYYLCILPNDYRQKNEYSSFEIKKDGNRSDFDN
jgi:hypothetical protein